MRLLIAGAAVFAGLFQMPTTPPMKLGLWETSGTITMQMPGMNMPPQPPRTVKSRVCVTAETWAKAFSSASDRTAGCTRSNESYGASRFSFDMSCPAMNSSAHFEMDFTSGDSGHGRMHMDMNPQGHHATVDTVLNAHYVSSDCGTLGPGKSEIVP
jgi:hypothetical protein